MCARWRPYVIVDGNFVFDRRARLPRRRVEKHQHDYVTVIHDLLMQMSDSLLKKALLDFRPLQP